MLLFLPTSMDRAAGHNPSVITEFTAGERIGQTFRALADGLEAVDLQWSSDRPSRVVVAWRLLGTARAGSSDGSGLWVPIYEGTTTVRLPGGRSTYRFA